MTGSAPQVNQVKKNATVSPASFVPWSVPAALFLTLGVALAGWGLPFWVSLLPLAGLPLAFSRAGPEDAWRLVALLSLLAPVGYARYDLWAAQANPLEPLMGETQIFSGVSDGRYLTLDEPAGVRVALSPSGALDAGRVRLEGTLTEAAGKRNPGGFDYQSFLRRRGVWAQLKVEEALEFHPAALGARERLRRGVVAGLEERAAGLMQAMTLGLREDLGDLRETFAASGLAHILALSGLHVGILMAALGFLLRPLGRARYPLMIVLVISFVALVGASPSVLRAGMMVAAVLLSLWLGGGRLELGAALGLAASITLLWQPAYLFDLSFQLSYLAVLGILLLTGPLTKRILGERAEILPLWHPSKFLVGSVVVSMSAQALSLPLVVSTFGGAPLFSPVVNVIAVPLASLLVPLGFLAAVLGLVWPPLAGLINHLTGFLAGALIALADAAQALPSLYWGEIGTSGYLFYAVGVLAFVLMARGLLRPWRGLLVIAAAMTGSTLSLPAQRPPEVVFLDVGQGDSALVRLPGRVEILVDGGGTPFSDFDMGGRTVVPALRALGVDELELVIASHPDTDHIEGLLSVLEEMPVARLAIGSPLPGNELFDELMNVAARRHIPVEELVRGESLLVGGARLDILNPPRTPFEEPNDNSVAFVLSYGGSKALFQGDAGVLVEDELAFPDVDVLMVGHHGSRFSTSEALLRAARPETAVISYGRNTYGHPNPDVVERLRAHGATVHETFKEGAVRVPLGP